MKKIKNERPVTDNGRKEITEVEKSAEKIWRWRDYFFHSEGNHHFYTDFFSGEEFLGDYQRLFRAMV